MKIQFNLTTSIEDMKRFDTRKDLLDLMKGFDGVELMQFEDDERGIIPKDRVIGLHMGYFPYWIDFWNAAFCSSLSTLTCMPEAFAFSTPFFSEASTKARMASLPFSAPSAKIFCSSSERLSQNDGATISIAGE